MKVLNGKIDSFTMCNVNKALGFLLEDSPDFLYMQTYNNNYDISYGYLSSCMDMTESEALFGSANLTNRAIIKPKGKGKTTKGRGGKKSKTTVKAPCAGGSGTGGSGAGDGATLKLTKEQIDATYHSNEVIRTVSSCMETPFWGTCSYTDNNSKCKMPNAKRTPDVIIAVVPENNTKYLRFPILTWEICGKKPPGPRNDQWFDGLNASMQALVFAPRAYYWEIGSTQIRIYKLEKVPESGFIKIHEKTYDLIEEVAENEPDNQYPGMMDMINDLCAILLDGLVNLAPICLNSAICLTDGKYKDFLNILSITRKNIEPHCWHIFVPEFLAEQQKVEHPFLDGDAEDPQKVGLDPSETVKKDHILAEAEVQPEQCAIPVDQDALDYSQIQDKAFYRRLPSMRSVRVDGVPASADDFLDSVKAAEKNISAHQALYRVKELFRRQKMSGIQILQENEAAKENVPPIDITTHPDLAASTAEQADRMTIVTIYESDEEVEEDDNLFEFEAAGETSIICGGGDNLRNMLFEVDDYGNLIKRAKTEKARNPLLGATKKHRFSVDEGTAAFMRSIATAKALVYPGTPAKRASPSGDGPPKKRRARISSAQRKEKQLEKKRREEEEKKKLMIDTKREWKKTQRWRS